MYRISGQNDIPEQQFQPEGNALEEDEEVERSKYVRGWRGGVPLKDFIRGLPLGLLCDGSALICTAPANNLLPEIGREHNGRDAASSLNILRPKWFPRNPFWSSSSSRLFFVFIVSVSILLCFMSPCRICDWMDFAWQAMHHSPMFLYTSTETRLYRSLKNFSLHFFDSCVRCGWRLDPSGNFAGSKFFFLCFIDDETIKRSERYNKTGFILINSAEIFRHLSSAQVAHLADEISRLQNHHRRLDLESLFVHARGRPQPTETHPRNG